MAFGFGVGDIIKGLELVNEYWTKFKDCPKQLHELLRTASSLSSTLRQSEDTLRKYESELADWERKELLRLLGECYKIVNDLKGLVAEHRRIQQEQSNGLREKLGDVWRRLNWDSKKFMDLQSRIVMYTSFLNIFIGNLTNKILCETKREVDRIHERQDERERLEEKNTILKWLTPVDYALLQNDIFRKRQEGTGQWFLRSREFTEWLERKGQTLFSPGIPGAGKTIMTSIVIDHLKSLYYDEKDIGIAYIYCNFREQDIQNPIDIFLSLLKQLLQDMPHLPGSVTDFYKRHAERRERPTSSDILSLLTSTAKELSRVFIIIDALDECKGQDENSWEEILEGIFILQDNASANVFATSRYIREIAREFEGSILLPISANEEDVRMFLNGNTKRLPLCVRRRKDLQEEVKAVIMKASDGMFLLARLHLDSLTGQTSVAAVREALRKLPMGSDAQAYDRAYAEAMKRIESQVSGYCNLAKQVLLWIVCSRRHLTIPELQHALAINGNAQDFDEDYVSDIDDILSVCAGLVIIDEESNIVRLVHYTTQEYFDRKKSELFPDAQATITRSCLTYLSYETFSRVPITHPHEVIMQQYVFYNYAACHWGHHARDATYADVKEYILSFLVDINKVSRNAFELTRHHGNDEIGEVAGLHLTAYFGLKDAALDLIGRNHDPDIKDWNGRTPLLWAAEEGQEDLVRLLLSNDKVDPESKDEYGRTALWNAASEGHENVVKLLLEKGADPNHQKYRESPPLWIAVLRGHDNIVKVLLEKGASMESRNSTGQTLLSVAARYEHPSIVKKLLEMGVDSDAKDNSGQTPLFKAARRGNRDIVNMLLKKGADPDSKDNNGQTPLFVAARCNHEDVVKILLEKGADPNIKDNYGQTPLSELASNDHKNFLKLFLKVDRNSHARWSATPITQPEIYTHESIVKLLLEKGADPGSHRNVVQTPLLLVAGDGDEKMARMILENDTDPDPKDDDGRMPLPNAARNRHRSIAELLLERGAGPDPQDNIGLE